MDSHLKVNGALDANFKLIPNLPRDFRSIQGRAKALLERQGNRVEWPRRSIKHLRSTYASRISEHVSPFQLKELLGHSSVTTTECHTSLPMVISAGRSRRHSARPRRCGRDRIRPHHRRPVPGPSDIRRDHGRMDAWCRLRFGAGQTREGCGRPKSLTSSVKEHWNLLGAVDTDGRAKYSVADIEKIVKAPRSDKTIPMPRRASRPERSLTGSRVARSAARSWNSCSTEPRARLASR